MNPTPDRPVTWGEMTAQEMMLPWFGVVVNGPAEPDSIAFYRPGDFAGRIPGPPGHRVPEPRTGPTVRNAPAIPAIPTITARPAVFIRNR
jgi:hypothetical protein